MFAGGNGARLARLYTVEQVILGDHLLHTRDDRSRQPGVPNEKFGTNEAVYTSNERSRISANFAFQDTRGCSVVFCCRLSRLLGTRCFNDSSAVNSEFDSVAIARK